VKIFLAHKAAASQTLFPQEVLILGIRTHTSLSLTLCNVVTLLAFRVSRCFLPTPTLVWQVFLPPTSQASFHPYNKKETSKRNLFFPLKAQRNTVVLVLVSFTQTDRARKFRRSARMIFFYVLLHSISFDLISEKCCVLHSFILKLNLTQVHIKLVQN